MAESPATDSKTIKSASKVDDGSTMPSKLQHNDATLLNAESTSLLKRIRELEAQLAAEKATRQRLATKYGLHPNPDRSILDILPIEIVISILELVLVQDEPLMLNQLLTRPREDNVPALDELPLSVRQPIIGTDWFNLTREEALLKGMPRVDGYFEYKLHDGQLRWAWQPKTGYKEMWDIINTCKVFRREGLKLLLGKNSFVISPVWRLRKADTDRYWCVKTGDYTSDWTGNNGMGEDGNVPVWRNKDFALLAGTWEDETITSEQLRTALASRPLCKQEYFLVPKALVGLSEPATLIRHVHVGFQICSHIPSDAVHFFNETLSFIKRFKEFENINTITLRISASWQSAYQWNWGDWSTKSDTMALFVEQVQQQALPGRRWILECEESATIDALKPHIRVCGGPWSGLTSLYTIGDMPTSQDRGPDVIVDLEGNLQDIDWEQDGS